MEASGEQRSRARQEGPAESRISWRTLTVASVASVAAAFLVSSLWAPGTLIGAAVTPVVVALVSELVRKPIEAVPSPSAALAPLRPSGRGGPPASAREHPVAPPVPEPAEPLDPTHERPAHGRRSDAEAGREVVHEYPRSDHRGWDRRRIRLALVTGALAFAIAVGFFVVADLTTGSAITGRGGSSSLFSPRQRGGGDERPATTSTTPAEQTTPQQTTTPPADRPTTEQETPSPTTEQEAPATRTAPSETAPTPAPTTATPPSVGGAAPQEEQPQGP
ncbi:hypothetical protein [Conexibacter arvalis]|uniref:Uncharacterized protein n=1 Tax=Conexibacter arvalis TaxID=912552 RepID=A0A840IAP5_9ACTN|nr:hypothetical protein [Conexibacter arvalis]MBB4661323.1 hypothetical protein [Conexibacter arvalis]